MKVRLLKKLRRRGQNQVHIHSVTTEGDTVIGMSIGYDEDKYSGLFCFGNTEEEVKKKAERIYIEDYLQKERARANDFDT
jgi:hypothetical protein